MIVRLEKDEALKLLEADRARDATLSACAMCRLVQADREALQVRQSEHGCVVLDEYAATEGHLLVIAKAHLESPAEVRWEIFEDLSRLVWEASRVVDRLLYPERIYTATLGASSSLPMSFPHHHTHVVPVYDTDERARPAHVFSWSAGITRYEPGEAEALAGKLREQWAACLAGDAQALETRSSAYRPHEDRSLPQR